MERGNIEYVTIRNLRKNMGHIYVLRCYMRNFIC